MDRKLNPQQLEAWRLLLTSHAHLVGKIDAALSEVNQIPLNWYDVLIELYEAPARKLRMSDLAERVLLTRSGLTRLVDRLEKQGYLQREIDPEDRRGFYAVITSEGIEVMRQAWPIYEDGIYQNFAIHLTDEEAALLANVFSRILDNPT